MAVLDQGVDLAGDEIDAGEQADRAVALVFVIAGEARVRAGLGRQVRGRRRDRLDAGLLVVGDHRHRRARLRLRCRGSFFQDLHLAVDAQHLRHLFFELGVAAFQE